MRDFVQDVLTAITRGGNYVLTDGRKVQGDSYSSLATQLREMGWRLDKEEALERAAREGFKVYEGRGRQSSLGDRDGVRCVSATIVTLEVL